MILFIDELHMLLGLGASGGGSMDAGSYASVCSTQHHSSHVWPGNILKPALARGELHLCGATTLDEYRKHIEKVCV